MCGKIKLNVNSFVFFKTCLKTVEFVEMFLLGEETSGMKSVRIKMIRF